MQEYAFRARDIHGQRVESTLFARTREEALAQLADKNLFVLALSNRKWISTPFSGLPVQEVWTFNQKLIALVRAGINLSEALEQIARTTRNQRVQAILAECIRHIREGHSFYQVARYFPEFFDDFYVATLLTAEKTGGVLTALIQYQGYLTTRIRARRKILNSMAYPAFLLTTMLLIVGFLFAFVLPKFATLYADMQAQLPLPTRVLIHVVDYIYLYLPALIFIVWGIRRIVIHWQVPVPLLSSVVATFQAAYIARSLSAMLLSGATVPEGLRVTISAANDAMLVNKMEGILKQVEQGDSIAEAFARYPVFPDIGNELIAVGEGSGQLPGLLVEVAEFYENKLESQLGNLTALVEPLLMLIIGLFVGGIIITMYLPIFSIAEVIK